jgi:hypothetical protein
VAFVRATGPGTLLVPEDGALVTTADAGEDGVAQAEDPTPGERYAAFPLVAGRALPPGRASTVETVEIEALTAEARVGAIEVAWRVAPGATVVVRQGKAPIAGPTDGELLYWGRAKDRVLQDCLDPDQQVHYRAFALGARGTLSPGLEAAAVALGPPPALGAVRATPGDRKVTLAWTWPDARSYDRVLIRREPAWDDDPEREVARGGEAAFVDEGAPLGQPLVYELRAALGKQAARRETKVTTKALAELASFRALAGGRSVVLEYALPPGLPSHGVSAQVIRNTDGPPKDMDDGSVVRFPKGATRHVDEPLPPGRPVHYRACVIIDGTRSPGLAAEATPAEKAGQLTGVQVAPQKGALEVRFTPPAERCDAVELLAGPASGALAPVECDATALKQGGPVRVEAAAGEPWRVRLIPVFQGNADASQAVDAAGTAWDDARDLVARPAPAAVELAWTPPAAPPRAYRLKRAPKGKDDEAVELPVPADAARYLDQEVQTRRTYVYTLTCRWGPEGQEVETPPLTVETAVWSAPPDVGRPELRSVAGGVQVTWLPCDRKDSVHWDGVAIYASDAPEEQVRAALEGRLFTKEDAPGLGLTLVEERKKAKAKETARVAPPPEGAVRTYALASVSGPMQRAVLVAAAIGLPEGFLALRPQKGTASPTVAWELPRWAKVKKLTIARGLEDAALEGLDPKEVEELSQPWKGEVDPKAGSFIDAEALAFVSWGYALEATLDVGGQEVVVPGPRAVVERSEGGKLLPKAEQPKGWFSKKQEVHVTFEVEGGKAIPAWPAFQLTRGVEGQVGTKVVHTHPGGAAPAPFTDGDLSSFTKGMTLAYAIKLERPRDALGFKTGEAKVTLG